MIISKFSKMFVLVIYLLFYLIPIHYGIFNNPEILSTYPFTDKYKLWKDMEVESLDKVCPGFNCKLSGLTHTQIDALISKENEIRDLYANANSISNIYSVQWDEMLALLAQDRIQICCMLPPTKNTVIYERVTNDWMNRSLMKSSQKTLALEYPTAVEVVIASRSIPKNSVPLLRHSITDYIEVFNNIEDDSNPLNRRGGTVEMGCSYLMAGNKTFDFDYMVCLYGYLYFDPSTSRNMYQNKFGVPCSSCTFYKSFAELPETLRQKWSCGNRYPHTCSNLMKRYLAPLAGNDFNCNGKIASKILKNSFFPSWYGLQAKQRLEKRNKTKSEEFSSSGATKSYFKKSFKLYISIFLVTLIFTNVNVCI